MLANVTVDWNGSRYPSDALYARFISASASVSEESIVSTTVTETPERELLLVLSEGSEGGVEREPELVFVGTHLSTELDSETLCGSKDPED